MQHLTETQLIISLLMIVILLLAIVILVTLSCYGRIMAAIDGGPDSLDDGGNADAETDGGNDPRVTHAFFAARHNPRPVSMPQRPFRKG